MLPPTGSLKLPGDVALLISAYFLGEHDILRVVLDMRHYTDSSYTIISRFPNLLLSTQLASAIILLAIEPIEMTLRKSETEPQAR